MSANNLNITPALSSINAQHMAAAPKNSTNNLKAQTPVQPKPVIKNPDNKKSVQENKKSNTKKIVITAGIALAALGGIYALTKSGKGKEKVQETAQNTIAEIAQNNKAAESALDKLDYKIKAPNISDLADKDFPKIFDAETLEPQYRKIGFDIKRDPDTLKRYEEVTQQLTETGREINEKIKEFMPDGKQFGIPEGRPVYQKRYFSLPENHKDGYCCEDPLLSKTAREEIVDTYLGYTLLDPIHENRTESRIINGLKNKFSLTNEADNKFIDECVLRLTSNNEAYACGQNSVFHAYELARLGKIFREAMGIAVK